MDLRGLVSVFAVFASRSRVGGDAFIPAQVFLRLLRLASRHGRGQLGARCEPFESALHHEAREERYVRTQQEREERFPTKDVFEDLSASSLSSRSSWLRLAASIRLGS